MPAIGDGYRRFLPPGHAEALEHAAAVLSDQILEDYAGIEVSRDLPTLEDEWTLLGTCLPPPPYAGAYDPGFVRRFTICFLVVGWKLAQPEPVKPSCVAEELALWAIVELAAGELDAQELPGIPKGISPDFSAFCDAMFEAKGLRWDFHPERKNRSMVDQLGDPWFDARLVVETDFSEWFEPFRPDRPPHPYVRDWAEHARRRTARL